MKKSIILAACLMALSWAGAALAQVSIDIYGPGQGKMNLVLSQPLSTEAGRLPPSESDQLQKLINNNLAFLPFLNLLSPSQIPGGASPGGVTGDKIDFKRYQLAQTDILVTSGWTPTGGGLGTIELRAFQVGGGSLLLGKSYADATADQLPQIANRFCSQLMEILTGKAGFFDSLIAFVKKRGTGKEIWMVSPQGQNLKQVTSVGGLNMNPAWSWDGRLIAFTHIGPSGHELGVLDVGSGSVRTVHLPSNTVIGPAFLPNGQLAVALDKGGNPDIWALDRDYKPASKLVASWAIDISPSFDQSGSRFAFVSSRLGNPHIFLSDGGSERRVTFEGKYNTSPSLSPDGKLVTFSRQMSDGHRIFVYDLEKGSEKQISFGPGNDEEPSFSPDGYFIVFSSSRAGGYKLYLTTRHGDAAIQVPTGDGDATAPYWSARGAS